ncbi:hypothetical protein AB0758_48805 [Tolypothrix bouteillei VB521301_2]|uniref:hypothetical protein n=1 Tax=Tolypothrix bouteillei TaxID=1246981 RepID=UPI0038B4F190
MSASSRLNPQEELTEIEQQIIANCQRLTSLLGLSETNQITLTVNLFPYTQLEINPQQYCRKSMSF